MYATGAFLWSPHTQTHRQTQTHTRAINGKIWPGGFFLFCFFFFFIPSEYCWASRAPIRITAGLQLPSPLSGRTGSLRRTLLYPVLNWGGGSDWSPRRRRGRSNALELSAVLSPATTISLSWSQRERRSARHRGCTWHLPFLLISNHRSNQLVSKCEKATSN